MKRLKRSLLISKPILVALLHLFLILLVYKLLFIKGVVSVIDPFQFKQWDANWYAGIAEHGYLFSSSGSSNSGFFPLFPYIWKSLWKFTGAGVEGICLFNFFVFYTGMLILKKEFGFSWNYFLLFLSIPSNMFMYVPYSEATFFFFSSIILAGYKTENPKLIYLGLCLAALTRPSALYFIPAIIVAELLSGTSFKIRIRNLIMYSSIPLFSIMIVVAFQYYSTNVWLAFLKSQNLGWARGFGWPELPLTTWDGFRNLWLDGFAAFFGFLAISVLLSLLIKKVRNKPSFPSKAIVFSLAYVAMTLIAILFFNSNDPDGGTTISSLNRHLLASPFFTIILFHLSHHYKLEFRIIMIYIIVAVFTITLLNFNGTGASRYAYNPVDKVFYAIGTLGLMLLYLGTAKQSKGQFILLIYLMNVSLQVIMLFQFSTGAWIG